MYKVTLRLLAYAKIMKKGEILRSRPHLLLELLELNSKTDI